MKAVLTLALWVCRPQAWVSLQVGNKVEAEFDLKGWSSGVVSRVFLPSGDVEVVFDYDQHVEKYNLAEQQRELRRARRHNLPIREVYTPYGTAADDGAHPSSHAGAAALRRQLLPTEAKRRKVQVDTDSGEMTSNGASALLQGLEHSQVRHSQFQQSPFTTPRGFTDNSQLFSVAQFAAGPPQALVLADEEHQRGVDVLAGRESLSQPMNAQTA